MTEHDAEIFGALSFAEHLVLARAKHALRAALVVVSEGIRLDLETDSLGLALRAAAAALEEVHEMELTPEAELLIEARIEQENQALASLAASAVP